MVKPKVTSSAISQSFVKNSDGLRSEVCKFILFTPGAGTPQTPDEPNLLPSLWFVYFYSMDNIISILVLHYLR